ncbi:hemerythrin domain-containing protein [Pseudonocardia lacus]|uniref:hemerythrin domain-containing protein n=1 Tax=Pseudonocardia lacus TaxID=2835865 RepID=UPI001BDCDA51|nr:hemerythrin domain-containing protein [Pseudonocardia lacus]
MSTRTETPDLLGIRMAHRMMRRDARRLTEAAERIAAGEACSPERAAAVTRWVEMVCDEVHHHHTTEDEALLPLLTARAGADVDLAELGDDHRALDPLLDAVRAGAAALATATSPADRRAAAAGLGRAMARVRDELDEHIEDEERSMFPMIEKYLTVAEWDAVEKRARDGGMPMSFMLPRAADVLDRAEFAQLTKGPGVMLKLLLPLVRPGYRRRELLVFG